MNINHIFNSPNFLDEFRAFDSNSSSRPVDIKWGGRSISDVTGPTPFIDISKSYNTTEAGVVESIVHTISLTGKIIKPQFKGISNVTSGIKQVEDFFKECEVSTLEITCSGIGTPLLSVTGAMIKGINFNKTNDNWTQSAEYSIDLEYKTAATNNPNEQVQDRSDSWTIEPLDDSIYTNFSRNAPAARPDPDGGGQGAVGGGSFGTNEVSIFNLPQFRITRRLSAKGLITPPTGQAGCLTQDTATSDSKKFFLAAKNWVDEQTRLVFQGSDPSGSIYIASSPSVTSYGNTWLYNHARTINIDVYNGTYETNDTWIAMPSGVKHTETFTIESSTDAENTKTVRVAGNIQGLSLTAVNIMDGSSGVFPPNVTQLPVGISLGYSVSDNATTSDIRRDRYINALEIWTTGVKRSLYRRASMVMHSSDRRDPRAPQSAGSAPQPPENPQFIKEPLLNVIAVSTSEGHDPVKGTISYSYEFNNKLQVISGVLSENIRITNTAPVDSIQEVQILGRALGPLLFSSGRTNPRKTLSIDIVVPKGSGIKATLQTESTCPMWTGGYFWQTVNTLVNGYEPFGNKTAALFDSAASQTYGTVFRDSDTEDWNPTEGRYSRSVSWIYQQCTNDRFYLNH